MTLTIVKRYNGDGEEIDETYQPVIPELRTSHGGLPQNKHRERK